jgi:uncharacterized membrane protein YkvI
VVVEAEAAAIYDPGGCQVLANYKKKSNIAAAVWIVSLIAVIASLPLAGGKNIWDSSNPLPAIIFMVNGLAFFYAFWAYAKAKGYSSALGLILPFFSVIGLIILAVLKDKHPEPK